MDLVDVIYSEASHDNLATFTTQVSLLMPHADTRYKADTLCQILLDYK